jgi:membrane protein
VAVLKGLGAYTRIDHGLIRPWLTHTFGGGELAEDASEHLSTLRDAFVRLLEFVNQAEVSSLGVVGLAALLYIIVALLSSTETALDTIFAVSKPRSIMHRAVNYAALLFIMPICIVMATALAGAVERWAHWQTGAGILLDIGSIVVAGLGLICLYLLMPNTRVTLGSAALGAMVGAVLGYAAFVVQVHVQVGVARYNLLYSSVSAFPLFLLWIFFSWLAVLFGAEVAAAHYDRVAFRWKLAGHRASFAQQERLALRIMTYVADAYLRALPPPSLNNLAGRCEAPTHLVQDVLDSMVAHRIVAPVALDENPGYLPARDINTVSTSELLQALRQGAPRETLTATTHTSRADDRAVTEVLSGLTGTLRESSADCSVLDLVERVRRAEEESQARRLHEILDNID